MCKWPDKRRVWASFDLSVLPELILIISEKAMSASTRANKVVFIKLYGSMHGKYLMLAMKLFVKFLTSGERESASRKIDSKAPEEIRTELCIWFFMKSEMISKRTSKIITK